MLIMLAAMTATPALRVLPGKRSPTPWTLLPMAIKLSSPPGHIPTGRAEKRSLSLLPLIIWGKKAYGCKAPAPAKLSSILTAEAASISISTTIWLWILHFQLLKGLLSAILPTSFLACARWPMSLSGTTILSVRRPPGMLWELARKCTPGVIQNTAGTLRSPAILLSPAASLSKGL